MQQLFHFSDLDARSFLSSVQSSTIDLVLTDPPYIISKNTGMQAARAAKAALAAEGKKHKNHQLAVQTDFGPWDKSFTMSELDHCLVEAFRVLRTGGTIIVFFDLWKLSELKSSLEKAGFKQLRFIEWIKTNPVPINSKVNYLTNAREMALVAVKGGKPTFNSEYDNGTYFHPIYQGSKGERFHPTQKSVPMTEELIIKHSNHGDVVLDMFAGSGTTGVAAILRGRQFVGCEPNPAYYSKAQARLSETVPLPPMTAQELKDFATSKRKPVKK